MTGRLGTQNLEQGWPAGGMWSHGGWWWNIYCQTEALNRDGRIPGFAFSILYKLLQMLCLSGILQEAGQRGTCQGRKQDPEARGHGQRQAWAGQGTSLRANKSETDVLSLTTGNILGPWWILSAQFTLLQQPQQYVNE